MDICLHRASARSPDRAITSTGIGTMDIRHGAISPTALALGAELRDARTQAGFGLRELANRAGLSPSLLAHWEAGTRKPLLHAVAFLLGLLNLPAAPSARLRDLTSNVHTTAHPEHWQARSTQISYAYERTAKTITEWAPTFLPLELQTR